MSQILIFIAIWTAASCSIALWIGVARSLRRRDIDRRLVAELNSFDIGPEQTWRLAGAA